MCVAILKPAGENIKKETLKMCFRSNPDGCGFAFPNTSGNSIVISKGFFSFRKFWKNYRQVPKGIPVMIHFRVKTSGQKDAFNCHPWRVSKRLAFCHNGNLESRIGIKDEECSDSGIFVSKILAPLIAKSPKLWKSDAFKWLINEMMGAMNKIILLDSKGEWSIFNERAGTWHEGVWFSNNTFKELRKKFTATTTYQQPHYPTTKPTTPSSPPYRHPNFAPVENSKGKDDELALLDLSRYI